MRSLCNNLSDPSLHLLAIALVLIYLAFGRVPWSDQARAEAPLSLCKACRSHYIPGGVHACSPADDVAHARR